MNLQYADYRYVNLDCAEAKEHEENQKRRAELQAELDKIPSNTHIPSMSRETANMLIDLMQRSEGKLYCVKFLREITHMIHNCSLIEVKQFVEQFALSEGVQFPKS